MITTPHCDDFGDDAVALVMSPAREEDDTDLDITGISAFGFHSCLALELY